MQSILVTGANQKRREEKLDELVRAFLGDYPHAGDVFASGQSLSASSIDKVRELIKFASIKPMGGSSRNAHKLAVIQEAQHMTLEAQNAILKILEEPPEYLLIALTAKHPDQLLPTVTSRTKIYTLPHAPWDEGLDKNPEEDYSKVLKMNLGQRLDWVADNKELIKENLDQILLTWERILRDQLLKNLDSSKVQKTSRDIKYLQHIRRLITEKNANVTLGIESLLVNLDV